MALRPAVLNVRVFALICAMFLGWNIATTEFRELYVSAYPSLEPSHSLSAAQDERVYLDRRCVVTGSLEERKRVRWVAFRAEQALYSQSFMLGGYYLEKLAFLALHVSLFALAALFAVKSAVILLATQKLGLSAKKTEDWLYLVGVPVFGALSLYVFHTPSSGFTFSIIEGFCIAAALYLALKKRVLLFTLVVLAAVLNRESGFITLLIWYAINGRGRLPFPALASTAVFLLVNLDIAACFFEPNFFLSFSKQEGQLTIADVPSRTMSAISSVLLNLLFLLSLTLGTIWKVLPLVDDKLAPILRRLVYLILLYLGAFVIATPLHHMSVKYLIVPLITVLVTLYLGALAGRNGGTQRPAAS